MSLLNPIWLWGLSALSIPVAIHLLSRKEGPVIRVGSIRFLSETSTSKFSSIRLNEVALLIVRSTLILMLTLFLAGMLWPGEISTDAAKWAVVEQGLEQDTLLKPVLDSLQKNGYALRELSPGFSEIQEQTGATPDYFALIEDLATRNVRAIVFARNELTGFKGKRTVLPANIQWITYPDNLTSSDKTSLAENLQPVHVTLAYDPDFIRDKKIISAALATITSIVPGKISVDETLVDNFAPSNNAWLIWLSDKHAPSSGKVLILKQGVSNQLITQENKDRWLLTKRLNEENAVDEHLAIELATMFFNQQIRAQLQAGNVTVPNELVWSTNKSSEVATTTTAGISIDKYLLLLIIVLFIVERVLAFYRKQ